MFASDSFRQLFPFLFKDTNTANILPDSHLDLICHAPTGGVPVFCDQRYSLDYLTTGDESEQTKFNREVIGFRNPKCESCAACATVLGYTPIIERKVVIVESQIEEPAVI